MSSSFERSGGLVKSIHIRRVVLHSHFQTMLLKSKSNIENDTIINKVCLAARKRCLMMILKTMRCNINL